MNIETNFVAFVKVRVVTVQEIISLYRVYRPYLQLKSGGVLICNIFREIQGTDIYIYICQS